MPYRYAGLHPVEHAGSPAGVVRPGEIRDEPIEDFGPWDEIPPGDEPLLLDVPPGAPDPASDAGGAADLAPAPAPSAAPPAPAAPSQSAKAPRPAAEWKQ